MRCAAPRKNTLCIRAEVRGVQVANALEIVERVHQRVQGTRSHPTIQGHGEAGRVPGDPVLTIVLAGGAVPAGRPFPTREGYAQDQRTSATDFPERRLWAARDIS
jgi:hypothetical protein